MQKIRISNVTDAKQGQYGWSSKVWYGNNEYFYVNSDATPHIGKLVEAEILPKPGKNYKVGKIVVPIDDREATATASNGNSNGAKIITWDVYRAMAEAAHSLAMKLEPDEVSEAEGNRPKMVRTNRSKSRAAIMNTILIAYANGKIFVPEDEDEEYEDEPTPF